MIHSQQNPSRLLSATIPSLILHLYFHYIAFAGVGGVDLKLVNSCSQTIWTAVESKTPNANFSSASGGDEVRVGSSLTIQIPDKWSGRVWGKTGCIFNESGTSSCTTGDDRTAVTVAELSLQVAEGLDYYDVSLVDGYNLPLLIKPNGGCASAGCIDDLNKRCPPELRTEGAAACKGPCTVFMTPEYCCTGGVGSCGPTNYSKLFKEVCPRTFSYPYDDASGTFTCAAASLYTITFCPPNNSYLVQEMIPPPPTPANNYPPPEKGPDNAVKNRAREIVTIVALSIGGVMAVIISTCCFLKRRYSKNGNAWKPNRDVENLVLQHGSLAPKRYKYLELKKITKSWTDKLGRGGYGSVYKGMLPDGCPVAVKILIETDHSNGEEFINEVVSISKTSHVNIVTLLGFCYEGNKRALVYEYMPNSSLDKFLSNNDSLLDSEKLYNIAVGIAKGLEYLHTGCITRIVHFDIKPQNILLDEEFCPKISDFGLAKLCKKKQSVLSVVGMRGTVGYIAPEVFSRNFGGVSHKSDVYSYGKMILEMAGAKKETQAESEANQSSECYFPDKIYEQVMLMGVTSNDLLMEEEEERRKKLFLVGFWCIQTNPLDRPSISKVVEMLEGSVEAIQIPPKPFLFSPPFIPDQDTSSSDYAPTVV